MTQNGRNDWVAAVAVITRAAQPTYFVESDLIRRPSPIYTEAYQLVPWRPARTV
jgi:hypothetical protein